MGPRWQGGDVAQHRGDGKGRDDKRRLDGREGQVNPPGECGATAKPVRGGHDGVDAGTGCRVAARRTLMEAVQPGAAAGWLQSD